VVRVARSRLRIQEMISFLFSLHQHFLQRLNLVFVLKNLRWQLTIRQFINLQAALTILQIERIMFLLKLTAEFLKSLHFSLC